MPGKIQPLPQHDRCSWRAPRLRKMLTIPCTCPSTVTHRWWPGGEHEYMVQGSSQTQLAAHMPEEALGDENMSTWCKAKVRRSSQLICRKKHEVMELASGGDDSAL